MSDVDSKRMALGKQLVELMRIVDVLVEDAAVEIERHARDVGFGVVVVLVVDQLLAVDIKDVAVGDPCGADNVIVVGNRLCLQRAAR